MLNRAHIGHGIWGAGIALGVLAGAFVGACGLPGATPSGSSTSGGGTEASSSSRGPSSSSGHQTGGAGGMGGAGGTFGSGGTPAQGGGSTTGGGRGGATASSASTGPTRSCTDEYGMAPGFFLCVETDTYCDFNLNTGAGQTSCGATCSQYGGTCIIEMDNLGNCDLFTDGGFACTDSHFGTTLCRCTHF